MTTLETFIENVKKMREHQRAYFKYRQRRDLIAAKELESAVDRALVEGISPTPTLPILDEHQNGEGEKQAGLFE